MQNFCRLIWLQQACHRDTKQCIKETNQNLLISGYRLYTRLRHYKLYMHQLQLIHFLCYNMDNKYIGIGNIVDYRFYPYFIRQFIYPYTWNYLFSTWKYLTLSILMYFGALKFLGFYPHGVKLCILWNKQITFCSSSSKKASWLEIHRSLVQAIKFL